MTMTVEELRQRLDADHQVLKARLRFASDMHQDDEGTVSLIAYISMQTIGVEAMIDTFEEYLSGEKARAELAEAMGFTLRSDETNIIAICAQITGALDLVEERLSQLSRVLGVD